MDNKTNYKISNIPKSAGKKIKRGCLIILSIPVLAVAFIISYYFIVPGLFPNSFRGDLQNLRVFPSADGKYKLWIQNDGTFKYTSRSGLPGTYNVKTKGLFCKTYSYVYDPVTKEVIKGFKTSYDDLPPDPEIVYEKGKIWVINSASSDVAPEIKVYNSENYQQVFNTQSFCEKYKELSSGIENVTVDYERPVRFRIATKDGKELLFVPADDKFFASSMELDKYYREADTTATGVFVLSKEENSDKRKKLYYVTGPKYDLYFSTSWVDEIVKQNIGAFKKLSATEILPDKVFIEGTVLFSDDDIAVIVHQDNVSKNANRMLTCVDKTGKELWTVQQKDLFDEMKINEKDSRTEMSFLKTQLTVQRMGDVIVFIYKPEGAMGFQLATGNKLWEFIN